MSFFSALARAFGFGSAEDEAVETTIIAELPPTSDDRGADAAAVSAAGVAGEFPPEFFDAVLEVFNNAQPDFIRECIDRNAQRRYLLDQLGRSFSDWLTAQRASLEKSIGGEMAEECHRLREAIAEAEARTRAAAEKVEHTEEQRLSAERQKRALADKLHDMEQRVMRLDEEKEKLVTANRHLEEKIKAAADTPAESSGSDELAALRTRLSQTNFVTSQLKEEVERLKKENAETAELYKSRMAMSDKMLTDLRNSSHHSTAEVKRLTDEAEALRGQLAGSEKEREKLAAQLAESADAIEAAAEVSRRLDGIDAVIEKRDAKIAALKASLDAALKEVEELKAAAKDSGEAEALRPRRKRKARPKISAIDETIDSTEWLVAAPPEKKDKHGAPAPDTDFGYQEPARKTPPANDAQMLLF